jgi:hypothetical protein
MNLIMVPIENINTSVIIVAASFVICVIYWLLVTWRTHARTHTHTHTQSVLLYTMLVTFHDQCRTDYTDKVE